MPLNHWPHLASKLHIAGPEQMPHQSIDINQVHVVMVMRNIAAAVQQILFGSAVFSGVRLAGLRLKRGHILPCGPMAQVRSQAIVPAKIIESIRATPSRQGNSPGNAAVHHGLLRAVPDAIRGSHQRRYSGVQISIRRLNSYAAQERINALLAAAKEAGKVIHVIR